MENKYSNISKDMFELTQLEAKITDTKFETKAVGYFGDALRRFRKNKSSVVAFFILVIIILFAIFAPIFSPYDPILQDHNAMFMPPKIPVLESIGIADGTKMLNKVNIDYIISESDPIIKDIDEKEYDKYYFLEYIKNYSSIEEIKEKAYSEEIKGVEYQYVNIRYDVYGRANAKRWESGKTHTEYLAYKEKGAVALDEEGNEMIEVDKSAAGIFAVRPDLLQPGQKVEDFYVYRIYVDPLKSGASNTYHYFGTDAVGRDLWTRLWYGTRTSLLIGLFVAVVTIVVGVIWGAISGYYGGSVDLIMERFVEILGGIPWIAIMIVIKMLLTGKVSSIVIVAISLVLTSWIGTASMVRTQMYRYKNREYVLASRTLGASDYRLITKHILPNALGTIVTSCVLVIPSAIFFESSVAYLGLGVNASTLSIGNLLSIGREMGIVEYPYLTLFPALIISILMISFNMFGNGLRDALNPALRGAE